MLELRKDYLLKDRWVIIATGRGRRPHEFSKQKEDKTVEMCAFDPGNEHMTPPEIDRIEEDGEWKVRCFPNLYPADDLKGNPSIIDEGLFVHAYSFGKHEVVANTPVHEYELKDLDEHQLVLNFEMYKKRVNELNRINGIQYVVVFHNQGKEAGGSLVHTHSQIIAINQVPDRVEDEIRDSKLDDGRCGYCKVIDTERNSERFCFENDNFIAFCPFASRSPFEIWIFPKEHKTDFNDFAEYQFKELASILKKTLVKLGELNAPYNFFFHIAPVGRDLHFHIELIPRLTVRAGFEFATDTIINTMSPEEAAKFYRGG